MIKRTFDAAELNRLANSPAIRPYMLGEGDIDLTIRVENVQNFAFHQAAADYNFIPDMGFLFDRIDLVTVEVHTMSHPGSHFPRVLTYAEEVRDWMFQNTVIERMYTKIAKNNPGARMLATKMGFQPWHELGRPIGDQHVDAMVLSLDRWASVCSGAYARGKAFHNELKAKTAEGEETHEDDEAHDHFVGAALLIAETGNPVKGLDLYNRWARMAGYQPVDILAVAPLVVHIGTALVGLENGRMEVLKCLQEQP